MSPVREMTHDFAVTLENVWLDQAQALSRRPCQHIVNNSVPVVDGTVGMLFEYIPKVAATTGQVFGWVDDGKIYPWATTWAAAAQDTTPADLAFSTRPRTATLGNFLVVANGVDAPMKYNGSTWTPITTPPTTDPLLGNILYTHAARMYAAGSGVDRMILFYSDVPSGSGADDWSIGVSKGGGFLDLSGAVKDGDEITGLSSFQGMLVVFLKNHIVFYKGTDPDALTGFGFSVHKVIKGMGCISHDSISGIGNDVIFLSQFGFKSLHQVLVQGDAAAKETSTPINNFVLQQIRDGRIPPADIRSQFIEEWGVYICYFGAVTLAYHTMYQAWIVWKDVKPLVFKKLDGTVLSADKYMHVMSTDNDGDRFYDYNAGAVGAEHAVQMIWETPPFRGGGNEVKTRWNRLELIFEATSTSLIDIFTWINLDKSLVIPEVGIGLSPNSLVTAVAATAWGGTWSTTAAPPNGMPVNLSYWAGLANIEAGSVKIPLQGRSEFISVRITNSTIDKFKITALEIYSNAGGLR
jgi:hypothetical protein